MVSATSSLQEWVQNDLCPNIDWEHWLQTRGLEPKGNGSYFQCKCPNCKKDEAVFYPNRESGNPRFECNHKTKCGYSKHVFEYLNGGTFPVGLNNQHCVKELADFAGMALPDGDRNYTPVTPRRHLLNDYWEFLKSHFKDSKAEQYVRDRGLDPDKHEFGLFPEMVNDVLVWAENTRWMKQDLEEAGLIKEGSKGNYVFCWGRIASAFKDSRGNVFNIWGRDLTGEVENSKKYLNLTNSLHAHKKAPYVVGPPSDTLVWCEGYLDACALAECGYHAAATGTNTVSDDMWSSTKSKQAILSLDTDTAGRKGAFSFLKKHLNDESPQIWFVDPERMQECKDLAELYQKHKKAAVDAALDTSTWIHRDKILADLLVQENSNTPSAPNDFEAEQISLKAYELDKRLSPARCPSFEKHFWRQLCEKIGFDLDTVKAHVDNNKERKRREQATKRITETSSAFQEALSKGDVDTAKRLQETITREFTQLSKSEEIIRVATIPVSKDMIKDELMRLGDGIKTGLFIGETEVLLTRGGLSTVGGATAHGKTTVMCNLALNIIKHDNTSVLYITIEEPTSAITTRLINIHCNLRLAENNIRTVKHWLRTGSEDMFTGKKAPAQFLERGEKFWDLIRSGQLNVVRGTKSLEEVIALIHAAVEHNPNMGCVVIDYLQLLYPDTPSSARHEEIKRICDSLLQTSISLGIAILSACQFNRDVKGYKDVVSTSLAEGGSIERYCDQVIGVWNHTFDTPPKDRLGIKILKERNGVIRHGELRWDGNLGLVENVVKA